MNKNMFLLLCKNDLALDLSKDQIEMLDKYYKLLIEWNKKFNLTRIIKYEDVLLKHFYDSLCLSKVIDLNKKISLCDMGTGAGFPGIVLKIVFKKLDITLLESNNKKCIFLNEVIKELDLKNIRVICSRVEEFAMNNLDSFDLVTTRAMANMRIISELALPMIKIGGEFLPLKSHIFDELEESKNIVSILGGSIESVYEYELPITNDKRSIPIIIKKTKGKNGFPRMYSKILKDVL